MGRLSMHSKCLDLFSFKFRVWVGEDFFSFFLCYQHVPFKLPMGSQCVRPWVFPIAPHFNPICFAQSPPLLTYITGPKGEALHLSIESFLLRETPQFQLTFGPLPNDFPYTKFDPKITSKCSKSHEVPYLWASNIGYSGLPLHKT